MNSPKIRFKGYTEDWEQRKVSELCSISTGKSNTQDKVEEGEYPFYVRSPIIERSTKYLYDEEAVITVGDGVGTGKVFHYVNGKYDLHQRCYRMYGFSDELNAHYFYHTFSKLFYKRVMAMTAKTSVDSVRLEMISDMKIPVPNVEEQRRIGNLLDGIDHLITLHQRKCEQTKTLKKYMLQKMFPQEGQKVPEIRFEGFTGDWEQRKVSEIAIEKLSNGIMNNQVNDETGLRHINVINMYDPDKIHPEKLTFSGYNEDAVKKCNVELGDIFLTRSSLKPEGIAEANVLLDSGRFVYDDHLIRLKVDKEKYDPFFVKLNLSERAFKRQFIIRAKTTAFTTIGQEDIAECSGLFPEKKEQEKIGTYFSQLDHLITLHQREYEKLQELKKFMLQNMFV